MSHQGQGVSIISDTAILEVTKQKAPVQSWLLNSPLLELRGRMRGKRFSPQPCSGKQSGVVNSSAQGIGMGHTFRVRPLQKSFLFSQKHDIPACLPLRLPKSRSAGYIPINSFSPQGATWASDVWGIGTAQSLQPPGQPQSSALLPRTPTSLQIAEIKDLVGFSYWRLLVNTTYLRLSSVTSRDNTTLNQLCSPK